VPRNLFANRGAADPDGARNFRALDTRNIASPISLRRGLVAGRGRGEGGDLGSVSEMISRSEISIVASATITSYSHGERGGRREEKGEKESERGGGGPFELSPTLDSTGRLSYGAPHGLNRPRRRSRPGTRRKTVALPPAFSLPPSLSLSLSLGAWRFVSDARKRKGPAFSEASRRASSRYFEEKKKRYSAIDIRRTGGRSWRSLIEYR